jgi:hypothetical protein
MAQIAPFKGILYNADIAGPLERVVAPPYDVISPTEQEALYSASPENFVRVILNRTESGEGESDSYQRAADYFEGWLAQGVLKEDNEEALYLYRQEFANPSDGKRYSRIGIFCALKLEPYSAGIVLPHEETRTKAKEDRLKLMRATRSNPEPIYALYEDPNGYVSRLARTAAQGAPDLSSRTAASGSPTATIATKRRLRIETSEENKSTRAGERENGTTTFNRMTTFLLLSPRSQIPGWSFSPRIDWCVTYHQGAWISL